ncbi:MAG: phosphatidylserine decarboxylase family protein [Candidatus Firestonebacteria bacterium]|nr:phosphatidylserine decarboxylase family protein [Candidatus Firestonebacteria bacterium]
MYTIIIIIICFLAGLAGYLFYVFFNRDPKRNSPLGNNIVSPADGKIIEILIIDNIKQLAIFKGLLGKIYSVIEDIGDGPYCLISIFMSPLVVHVQRIPISGNILKTKYVKGSLRVTNTLRAIDNERSETTINSKIGKIKVIQIAGLLARRIETWIKENEKVEKNQKLGIIKLGSQVCIIIPYNENINIKVKKHERVKAGETILAEFDEKNVTGSNK